MNREDDGVMVNEMVIVMIWRNADGTMMEMPMNTTMSMKMMPSMLW